MRRDAKGIGEYRNEGDTNEYILKTTTHCTNVFYTRFDSLFVIASRPSANTKIQCSLCILPVLVGLVGILFGS